MERTSGLRASAWSVLANKPAEGYERNSPPRQQHLRNLIGHTSTYHVEIFAFVWIFRRLTVWTNARRSSESPGG